MTWRWTDELIAPLAERLRDGDWDRVEAARDDGWLALARGSLGNSLAWHRFSSDGESTLTPVTVLADQRLAAQRALGQWLAAGCSIRLLAHKVGSRATFQLQPCQQTAPCFYAKVYHRNRSLVERWHALSASDRFTTPRVIDFDAESQVLSMSEFPGTSLNASWRAGSASAVDGQLLAELLHWIASHAPREELPQHGAVDEIRLLEARHSVYVRATARPFPSAQKLLATVAQALDCLPRPRVTLAHRDLHDKQVIVNGSAIGLIDLDLVANAPRELDAGNLLGHLRLRALKGFLLPWRGIASEVTRRLRALEYGRNELRTWTAATLTRLGFIYSHRHHERELPEQLFRNATDALGGANDWEDIL
ncbi:MAG: hypothetical protein ACKVX7_04575 [Planctomycetota bacterium]